MTEYARVFKADLSRVWWNMQYVRYGLCRRRSRVFIFSLWCCNTWLIIHDNERSYIIGIVNYIISLFPFSFRFACNASPNNAYYFHFRISYCIFFPNIIEILNRNEKSALQCFETHVPVRKSPRAGYHNPIESSDLRRTRQSRDLWPHTNENYTADRIITRHKESSV